MLRDEFNNALKEAMKARDQRTVSTLRMVLAALKDRDIEARGKGHAGGITEGEIAELLQKMIRQRQESRDIYDKAGRAELAQQEAEEIAVIERWLPKQMSDPEMAQAVEQAIAEAGAGSVKDMGRVMALLKQRYTGRMAFAKAGALLKQKLG
jgi:uncharacterized protein YqeY